MLTPRLILSKEVNQVFKASFDFVKAAHYFLSYLLLFLCWGGCCFAQDGQQWPRNPLSHTIELSGTLPWPAQAHTARQRRALIQHWYWTKLTVERTEKGGSSSSQEPTTYGGVPALGYFDQRPSAAQLWRLLFQLRLTPTPRGLAYRLSNFEYAHGDEDVSRGGTLEELLRRPPSQQPDLAAFHTRLLAALATW
jgi:hypothetical protein